MSSIPADYPGRLGTKLGDHLAQNRLSGVFGSFVDDWENSSQTPTEWPLSLIAAENSITVSLVVAENDTECPADLATSLATTLESAGVLAGTYTLLE